MIQRHAYPKAGRAALAVQDLVIVLLLGSLLIFYPKGTLAIALAAAIPIVVGWGALTLHFPSRVEVDRAGVTFFAYGRAHRFAWNDIEKIHVRRFVVRDRVLVRIVPAPAFRGRYWLLDSLEEYAALVRMFEEWKRGKTAAIGA